MENASKALIMAGTILIGILIIALFVYFFNSAYGLRKSYDDNISTTKMVEFNTQFTKYNITQTQYDQSDGKNYVRIYDIITLGNLAKEFNKDFKEGDSDYIEIKISDVDENISNNSSADNNSLLKNYNNAEHKFVSTSVEYSSSGRIKSMTFKEIKKDK